MVVDDLRTSLYRVSVELPGNLSRLLAQERLTMPEAFPPTVAEREAELVALQNAFDEYIASSRELEEELDAELAKLRK